MHVSELDTPSLLVDLDRLEANIGRLQQELDAVSVTCRPHIKTHKIPTIGRKQLAAGACGITYQKLGEAEIFAAAGFNDILLAYNVVGPFKAARLARLQHQSRVTAAVDALETARGISAAAGAEGVTVPLLVEIDAGYHRAGVSTAQDAGTLARQIVGLPFVQFDGLMCYPTTPEVIPILQETRTLLQAADLPCPVVSGGGTGLQRLAQEAGLSEHRSGTYVYNDLNCVRSGAAAIDQCALQVLVTLVSVAAADYVTIDGGSKTFTNDSLQADGHNGYVLDYPDAYLERLSEEHGVVNVQHCARRPRLGEQLRIIPNHACGTTNMHDQVAAHRGGHVEAIWPIAARGMIR